MNSIFSTKTLVPISFVIGSIPVMLWLFDIKARCQALESETISLHEDRRYVRQKIDDINNQLSQIQISIGIIDHELRSKKIQ
jgi:hypothetical protein